MSLARREDDVGMSVEAFRVFQRRRPDGERWELVGGVPVMMAPPTIVHQLITGNLLRLLSDALAADDEALVAIPAPGVDLGLTADVFHTIGKRGAYAPEPDVAIIRDTVEPDQRFARAVVLFAEVVSSTDEAAEADGRAWVDLKAELYRAHQDCEAVLAVEQDRVGIHLWQRAAGGWTETVLADLDDELVIACCGLRCRVIDVYRRTHLAGRSGP